MFKIEVVVIGAGVIGLAIARALAVRGLEVLVLEKESSIGQGISSRSSEVIHAGLYYPTGSLKAQLCVSGRRELYRYCEGRGVPYKRCGKLVVATSSAEDGGLDALAQRGKANDVEDMERLSAERLGDIEPNVRASSALLSHTTGIIDSHALMLAYQGDAESSGATISLRTPFVEGVVTRILYPNPHRGRGADRTRDKPADQRGGPRCVAGFRGPARPRPKHDTAATIWPKEVISPSADVLRSGTSFIPFRSRAGLAST